MNRPPSQEELKRQCEGWNMANPIGTPVEYHSIIGHPAFRMTRTRTVAQVLSGHTAVVWVDGMAGCVALAAVEAAG